MRNARLLILLAVTICLSASGMHAQEVLPDPELPTFAMVVEVSGSSVVATCAEGCSWDSASASYPGGRHRTRAANRAAGADQQQRRE